MKNVSSEDIKVILTLSQTLRYNYSKIGVLSTQRVRNPFPLDKLVVAILTDGQVPASRGDVINSLVSIGYHVNWNYLLRVMRNLVSSGKLIRDADKKYVVAS